MAVIVIVIGVGVASANDVTVDLVGVALAAIAVGCTVMAQILCSRHQKDLQCTSIQLLYSSCPLVTIGIFVVIPLFHDVQQLAQVEGPEPLLVHVVISCVLALRINVSNFLVLGKTSPLVYQVLGHFKTCVISISGFVVFYYQYNARVIVGISLPLGGVVAYTEIG